MEPKGIRVYVGILVLNGILNITHYLKINNVIVKWFEIYTHLHKEHLGGKLYTVAETNLLKIG